MKEKQLWSNTSNSYAHLSYGAHIEKNINIIKNLFKQSNVCIQDLNNILDWGPGGGWLSRQIGGNKLTLFDVVDKHEHIQRSNCKDFFKYIDFYDVSGENYPDIEHDLDLTILFSVIYHMPSLSYVRNAMNRLREYSPKFIAIRNIFSKNNQNWESHSFEGKNILRMNVYDKSAFLSLLPDYEIVASNTPKDALSLNGPACYVQSFLLKKRQDLEVI